jgi:aminomethyltransferase
MVAWELPLFTHEMLKKTPLNVVHRAADARMVDFGGWDMPVEYSGIVAEHLAVRNGVGLFDISHMGEIDVRGPQAVDLIDSLCSNRATNLKDGQAQYSGLMLPNGGFVDDLLVHRFSDDHYFLCVNASNQDKDFEWIRDHNNFDADVKFVSPDYVQLAIQGPRALDVAAKLTSADLPSIRYYWFTHDDFAGTPAIIARTGYTGEDGIEIYIAPQEGERVWAATLAAGEEFGIVPCGLGARNTLRLEASMSLYGHEINEEITAYEAGLGWIVKLKKAAFTGRDALAAQKAAGVKRKLVGFEMTGRGIGRDGYRVHVGGQDVGWVTSGSPAPSLGKNIGMCILPVEFAKVGQPIEIAVRSRLVEAQVVPTPFYSRKG